MKKFILMAAVAGALVLGSCSGNNKPAASGQENDSTAVADSATALTEESSKTVAALTSVLADELKSGDTKGVISTLANMETIYRNLVSAGKLDEAKAYGEAIKSYVSSHADALKAATAKNATLSSLVDGIMQLPTSAETTAEQAKQAVGSDVVNLASSAIAKGETAVADAQTAAEAVKNAPATVAAAAKNAATSAVSNAVSTAQSTAESAKSTAESEANAAVENARTKASNEVKKQEQKVNDATTKAQKKAADAVTNSQKKANDAVNKAADKALKGLGI